MNDESRLQATDPIEDTAPRKHLPEDTGRTLGPGHLDMVHERIDQAIGISKVLFAAIGNPDLPENAEEAAWGQQRLLEEAIEHLGEYVRERAKGAQETPNAGDRSAVSALLPLEEHLRMAKGQAFAISAGISEALGDDPLAGAGEALQRQLEDLQSLWKEQIHRNGGQAA